MICNKIARAVNGDPQYFDNWRDIAGYATLAEKACEVIENPKRLQITNQIMRGWFMSDFKKWFKSLNENGRVTYFLGQEGRISEEAWNHQQAIIDEHTEVIKLQDTDLRKYEKQIENLKEQLNNMEQCYIEKKKECEDQQKRIDAGLEKSISLERKAVCFLNG